MLKKVILSAVLTAAVGSVFANDLCTMMNTAANGNGAWTGTYLMSGKTFPVRLYLNYQANSGMVYGYTLPSKDSAGYGFGTGNKTSGTGHYFLWANCANSQLSNLYFVKNPGKGNAVACGTPNATAQAVHIGIDNPLTLVLPYQGQTNNLTVTMMPQSKAVKVDQAILTSVLAAAQTCK